MNQLDVNLQIALRGALHRLDRGGIAHVAHALAPESDEQSADTSGLGFDILPPIFQGRRTGITDTDMPRIQRQRRVFRGLPYRCAQIRANAFAASVNPREGQGATVVRRSEGNAPVEETHPWMRWLIRPNPYYSARFIWRWTQFAKDLSRGAFFIVEFDEPSAMPMWLHPVFPFFGHMEPVGNGFGGIEGFIFWRSDGRRFPTRGHLPRRQVLWVRHPHPVSPYESASLTEAAAYEIDIRLYMQVYRRESLRKGGVPVAFLTTDQKINEDQAEEWSKRFMRFYQGIQKVDAIPAFGHGAELKALANHARDIQFTEGAELNATEILDIFGIPEGLIHDKANRANAEAAALTFASQTAQVEANDNCDEMTHSWRLTFNAEDEDLVIMAPDLIPKDRRLQLDLYKLMLAMGAMKPDELRGIEAPGLDPLGGEADIAHISQALRPLATDAELRRSALEEAADRREDQHVMESLLNPASLPNQHFNALLDAISSNGR